MQKYSVLDDDTVVSHSEVRFLGNNPYVIVRFRRRIRNVVMTRSCELVVRLPDLRVIKNIGFPPTEVVRYVKFASNNAPLIVELAGGENLYANNCERRAGV